MKQTNANLERLQHRLIVARGSSHPDGQGGGYHVTGERRLPPHFPLAQAVLANGMALAVTVHFLWDALVELWRPVRELRSAGVSRSFT